MKELWQAIRIDGRKLRVSVQQKIRQPVDAPRLVIVGFQPNETAREILRLCIDSLRRFTPEPHELWVVDNYSPPQLAEWLADEPELNVIFNHTEPTPKQKLFGPKMPKTQEASYANGVALELAARVFDPNTRYLMTLHMDTMACRSGWLSYLRDKFNEEVRAVGVRMDTTRVRCLHILGMMFDFTLFQPLKLTFKHNLPEYDVGDGLSLALEKAGYRLWACRNTHSDPALSDALPDDSPYRDFGVDRALNDQHEVIFMHLGRGVSKSRGRQLKGKVSPEEWLRFGREVVLA